MYFLSLYKSISNYKVFIEIIIFIDILIERH